MRPLFLIRQRSAFVNMVGIVMILAGAPAVGRLADWTGQYRISFWALGGFALAAALTALTLDEETRAR